MIFIDSKYRTCTIFILCIKCASLLVVIVDVVD